MLRVLCVLSLLASCAPASDPTAVQVERVQSPIINGTAIRDEPWVVAIVRFGAAGGLCTGSVIGRFHVLTAKHCVFDEANRAVPPAEMAVAVGYDVTVAGGVERTVTVQEVRTTPGNNIARDVERGNDIAVLLLAEDVMIEPKTPSRAAPTRGQGVTIIGFGRTIPGDPDANPMDAGVKYRGTASVDRVGANVMETTGAAWTCQGDSGGPAITASGNIVGITSFGGSGCFRSNSFYTRVDSHIALVDEALRWEPPCEPSTETCDGEDNNCDGTIDENCIPLGVPCTVSSECANGTCEDVSGTTTCVRACDPRDTVPRCPLGFYCEETGCGTGRCLAGGPGPNPSGTECALDSECAALNCGATGGVTRCGRACTLGGAACDLGQLCETGGADCGTCIPVELTTSPRPFGSVCETSDQCESARCENEFCTRSCGEGCPAAFHCRGDICVGGALGRPGEECVTPEDCIETAPECVEADGDRLCSNPCTTDEECAAGLSCEELPAGFRCVPPGAPLGTACAEQADCRSGICAVVCTRICDELDPCPEDFECRPAGEVSGCFAPLVEPEPAPRDSGGCSLSPASSGTSILLLLLGSLLLARRRRNASRSSRHG